MNRKIARTAVAAAAAALLPVIAYAAQTFLTVSPTNLQGWQIQRSTSGTVPTPTPTPDVVFVAGPETPPLGSGSAEFRLGPDGGGAAQLRHPGYAGTRLPNPSATATPLANELTELEYSTYTQQDGSGGQSPYIILQIDTDGDAGIEDLLFFEPVYQSATFCPSNPQAPLVTGEWQTWDALNGCWYSVFGTNGSGPGTNTQPLRTLSAAIPNGVIANSSPSGLGGVRLVTGFGAGAWDNYVGNADRFVIGVGGNDTIYNFDPNETPPSVGPPATLLISEVRFRGPGGDTDEFVEIYNNTNAAHVVSPPDGSSGYAVVDSTGATRAVIPFGTTIPARGHFLVAEDTGYTLTAYPASSTTTAAPDSAYDGDMPNNDTAGVALFTTSNPANFTLANRLDAVGYANAPALYREGAGLTAGIELAANVEHSLLRSLKNGPPLDTQNNAADILKVATQAGGGLVLGAPGPENLSSPVTRGLKAFFVDPLCTGTAVVAVADGSALTACARERNTTPNPAANSTNGTLSIRRRFLNNTGQPITRLRFRVVDITTAPAPAGTADLRVRTSSDVTVVCTNESGSPHPCPSGGSSTTIRGTRLEGSTMLGEAPEQPLGGGWNSSLAAGTVALATPLAAGNSLQVQFLLGVQQTGAFRFFVVVEALSEDAPVVTAAAPSKTQRTKAGAPSRARRKD